MKKKESSHFGIRLFVFPFRLSSFPKPKNIRKSFDVLSKALGPMNIKKNTDGRRRQRRQRDNILQSVLLNKERMLRSVKLQEHAHHCTSVTFYYIFVVIVKIIHIYLHRYTPTTSSRIDDKLRNYAQLSTDILLCHCLSYPQ